MNILNSGLFKAKCIYLIKYFYDLGFTIDCRGDLSNLLLTYDYFRVQNT